MTRPIPQDEQQFARSWLKAAEQHFVPPQSRVPLRSLPLLACLLFGGILLAGCRTPAEKAIVTDDQSEALVPDATPPLPSCCSNDAAPSEGAAGRPDRVEGNGLDASFETILGTPPDEVSDSRTANFALPEDAIQLQDGSVIIADTKNGYIKRLSSGVVAVVAGDGSVSPDPDLISSNTPHKTFVAVALLPYEAGFISFSTAGAGLNFHHGNGDVEFLGNSYLVDGEVHVIKLPKFATNRKGGRIIFADTRQDGTIFLEYSDEVIRPLDLGLEVPNGSLMGFDFCPNSIVYSTKQANGSVSFYHLRDGELTRILSERPFSNAIYCLDDETFVYGARWELKIYESGSTRSLTDKFVHVAAIRESGEAGEMIITDSDQESVYGLNVGSGDKYTIASSEGKVLSDTVGEMYLLGDERTLIGMTSNNLLFQFDLESSELDVLVSNNHSGKYDSIIGEHEFVSIRGFAVDEISNRIFIASNHGIYLLDLKEQTFELYAGEEEEYGDVSGSRRDARFAVIRDLDYYEGNLYVADAWNDQIKVINTTTDEVSTFLGSGLNGFANPTDAECFDREDVSLNRPLAVQIWNGRAVVANSYSHNLISVPLEGGPACVLSGVAQPSSTQYGGGYVDGEASESQFDGPRDLFLGGEHLYVVDIWNNAIREVESDGRVTTLLAGDHGLVNPSAAVWWGERLILSDVHGTLKLFTWES